MKRSIPKDESCSACGTDLHWWLKQSARNKVYYHKYVDEYFCRIVCKKERVGVHTPHEVVKDRRVGKRDRRQGGG